jgi:hypothetical protein
MGRGNFERGWACVFVCTLLVGCSDRGPRETLGESRSESVVSPGQAGWPSAWSVATIGAGGSGGGATYETSTGVFTLHGACTGSPCGSRGVWDFSTQNSDAMRFLYTTGSGDVEFRAHVTSVSSDPGKDKGQIGIAIRDGVSDPDAQEAAGIIQIGGEIPSGTGACSSGVADAGSCTGSTTCFLPDDSVCTCNGTLWDCRVGHQQYVTFRSPSDSATPAYLMGSLQWKPTNVAHLNAASDFWLRLQRIGNDFSVSWQDDDAGPAWRPFMEWSGGPYLEEDFAIGFFAASQTSSDLVVTVDQLYAGPVNLETIRGEGDVLRTTSVGSTSAVVSSGRLAHDLAGFYVGSDGTNTRVYKHTASVEGGVDLQALRADNGNVIRLNESANQHGMYVDGAAIAGDASYIYVAKRQSWEDPNYCIERFTRDLAFVAGDSPCACTGTPCAYPSHRNLTQIGGMVAITHGGENRLYVTQADRNGTPKVVELHPDNDPVNPSLMALEVNDEWEVAARPSAIAGAHNRLWVAHSATDTPYLRNYDVTYSGFIGCYKYTDGEACGTIPTCTSTLTTNCVVSPTALALKPGAATNGSQDLLYVADNGIGRQNIHIFKDLHTSSPVEVGSSLPTLGQAGGIYAGTPGLIDDPSAGGLARFYNLVGVGVDPAGSVYVASSGIPALDIRKFTYASSTWSLDWQELGLMGTAGGSEVVDFHADDPQNDEVIDVYSFNKRMSFDTTETAAGQEWSYAAFTYDPECSGSPVACVGETTGESDGNVRGRPRGNVMMKTIDGERFMFVLSGNPLPEKYASDIGDLDFVGHKYAVNIYRFEGEIAVLAGSVGHVSVDVNPMPNGFDHDCDMEGDGNRSTRAQLTIWIDDDGDRVRDAGEISATPEIRDCFVNPACENWESEYDCEADPPGFYCDAYTSTASGCSEPTPHAGSTLRGFEVDSNGDLWLALQYDVWHLAFEGLNTDGAPEYAFATSPKIDVTGWGIGEAHGVDYDADASPARLHVFTPGAIAAYTNVHTSPSQVFLQSLEATTVYSTPEANVTCFAGNQAFDKEGDKIFVGSRCGGVLVHDASDGAFETVLGVGPGLSGVQQWQDAPMGIRARKLSSEEYLIAMGESNTGAHTPVFRWCPANSDCSP